MPDRDVVVGVMRDPIGHGNRRAKGLAPAGSARSVRGLRFPR